MRSIFKALGLTLLLCGLAFLPACDTTLPPAIPFSPIPPSYTPVVEPPFITPNRLRVADFDGGTDAINPTLFNPSNPCPPVPTPVPTVGCYAMALPGSVTFVNNFGSPAASSATIYTSSQPPDFSIPGSGILFPGAEGSTNAFHAYGRVTDGGDAKYPTLDLQAQMNSGAPYDASFFSGVRFYLKVGIADNATKRIFAIPLFATQGTPSGGCTSNCYDHFFVNYESTNGAWRLFNVDFLSMGRQGFGAALTPPTLSGENLKQVLWLMWQEGRNNTAGSSVVDLWVDSIEFY